MLWFGQNYLRSKFLTKTGRFDKIGNLKVSRNIVLRILTDCL